MCRSKTTWSDVDCGKSEGTHPSDERYQILISMSRIGPLGHHVVNSARKQAADRGNELGMTWSGLLL